jgi:two-component system response regulator YesN
MIHKTLLYIDEHFTETLRIDDIIKVACMSKSHFSPLFKKITGQTFVDYLRKLRVEHAKRLLVETGRPISQIGEDVGYTDERYFRRIFLETAGISLARYRREHKGE